MEKGTKFKAFRKLKDGIVGEPAFKSILHPKGLTLTCNTFIDGVITCKETTHPEVGFPHVIQIFTRFWHIYEM